MPILIDGTEAQRLAHAANVLCGMRGHADYAAAVVAG